MAASASAPTFEDVPILSRLLKATGEQSLEILTKDFNPDTVANAQEAAEKQMPSMIRACAEAASSQSKTPGHGKRLFSEVEVSNTRAYYRVRKHSNQSGDAKEWALAFSYAVRHLFSTFDGMDILVDLSYGGHSLQFVWDRPLFKDYRECGTIRKPDLHINMGPPSASKS